MYSTHFTGPYKLYWSVKINEKGRAKRARPHCSCARARTSNAAGCTVLLYCSCLIILLYYARALLYCFIMLVPYYIVLLCSCLVWHTRAHAPNATNQKCLKLNEKKHK